jgi:hypothetical protein
VGQAINCNKGMVAGRSTPSPGLKLRNGRRVSKWHKGLWNTVKTGIKVSQRKPLHSMRNPAHARFATDGVDHRVVSFYLEQIATGCSA